MPLQIHAKGDASTPHYIELRVSGGTDFNPGQKVVLEWQTYQDRYGFTGVPCAVYRAAALNPPAEDTAVTVNQIVSSKALFIFDSKLRPAKYNPRSIEPTYPRVAFPASGLGSGGTISLIVPARRCGEVGIRGGIHQARQQAVPRPAACRGLTRVQPAMSYPQP